MNQTDPRSLKARFDAVYRLNAWGDDQSASGEGSRLESLCVADAENAMDFAIRDLGVTSIVDAPCGDFNWMGRFLARHPGIAYRGFDIVEDLIAANRARHAGTRFDVLNLTEARPPRADLILCKDLVNHLNNDDVCRVLHNLKASGARYLLLSNNAGWNNVDLAYDILGYSRHLDVTRPPFNLPQPIWGTHYLGLWRTDQIPDEFILPATHAVSSEADGGRPADFVMNRAALMDDTPPLLVSCGRGATGIVLFGPYHRVKAGRYRAVFRIHCGPGRAGEVEGPCARVEVTAEGGDLELCGRSVTPADLQADPRVVLDFTLAAEEVLELRVFSFGRVDLIVDYDRHLVRAEQRHRFAP